MAMMVVVVVMGAEVWWLMVDGWWFVVGYWWVVGVLCVVCG